MKLRKWLITVCMLVFCLCLGLAFAGCGDDPNPGPNQGENPPIGGGVDQETCQHEWSSYTTVTERTCVVDGVRERTCNICGKKETQTDEAPGHTLIERDGRPATCTEGGFEPYEMCTKCDYTTRTDAEIPPLGHDLVEVEGLEPTCSSAGYTKYKKCTRCSYNTLDDESVPEDKYLGMLEHDFPNDEPGAKCTRCGATKFDASDGLEFTAAGTFAVVTGIGECQDTVISIPESYDGLPVTEIGESAFSAALPSDYYQLSSAEQAIVDAKREQLLKVTEIKMRSVQRIDAYAFAFMTSLTTFDFGDKLQRIGRSAFSQTGIETFTFPQSCTYIENDIFFRADNLREIKVAEGNTTFEAIENRYLITKGAGELKYACMQFELKDGEYRVVTGEEVKIPESVKVIDYGAFSFHFNMHEVTIPGTVTTIGASAFSACTNLRKVVVEAGVREIGKSAFGSCANLTSFEIKTTMVKDVNENGDSIEVLSFQKIGVDAFAACQNLKSIKFDGTKDQWRSVQKDGDGLLNNQPYFENLGGQMFQRSVYMEIECKDGKLKENVGGAFVDAD